MSYSFVEDDEIPKENETETTYSFVDEEEVPKEKPAKESKESKPWYDLSETAPVKLGKAAIRGVGTTLADIHSESSKGAGRGSIGDYLGFRNENAEEPELSKIIRENLPDKNEDDDGAIARATERAAKYVSRPESLVFGIPGAAASAVSGLAGQLVEEGGGGPGWQTLAEIGAPSYKALKTVLSAAKEQVPAAAKKIGGLFSKAEVKSAPAQIEQRMQSIGKDAINRLERETTQNAKPFQRGEFNAKEIANDLENVTVNRQLDAIAPSAGTKQQFGNKLVGSVEESFQEAKKGYDAKYDIVKERAPNIQTSSEELIKLNDKLIEEINSLETKPPNYQQVIDTVNDINKDLGKKVTAPPKNQLVDIHGNPFQQAEKVTYEKVPISKKMDLSRRINQIINYDLAEYSIKDRLKPIAKRNNMSIQSDLSKADPVLGQLYGEAQKEFGETAQKFGRESIAKLRKAEATEKAAAIIKSPTTLEDLKAIVPAEEYASIERQVLEEIKGMGADTAAKTLKEVSPHLSPEARIAGENIVQFKDPKYFSGKWNKHANAIMDELQEAFTVGKRPENTLKLMQTRDGYKTIYETLHNTPTGKKALGYLQKQYIDDMVVSALKKDGSLDWEKLGNIMNSNETNKIIVRQSLGKQGLVEFEKFAEYGKNIAENFKRYGPAVEGNGILKMVKTHGKNIALPAIGLISGGIPLAATGVGVTAAAKLTAFLTRRTLASPRAQAAFKQLANPSTWKDGNAEKVAQSLFREAANGS